MSGTLRPKIIAGNWKMYESIKETKDFIKKLVPLVTDSSSSIFLSVPFTAIQTAAELAKNSNIIIGAQNMNDASEGAFTGEIAASMLVEAGAKFVILGHSERRSLFNESSAFINKKIKRALAEGLTPIVCVGETSDEREASKTEEVIKTQLSESLADINEEQLSNTIIAYEPVWAIGTGKTATPELAQEVHAFCRQCIGEQWGEEASQKMVLLYGGSVKPKNSRSLMEQPDIDGLLVGGASLDAETFSNIIHYQNALTH